MFQTTKSCPSFTPSPLKSPSAEPPDTEVNLYMFQYYAQAKRKLDVDPENDVLKESLEEFRSHGISAFACTFTTSLYYANWAYQGVLVSLSRPIPSWWTFAHYVAMVLDSATNDLMVLNMLQPEAWD